MNVHGDVYSLGNHVIPEKCQVPMFNISFLSIFLNIKMQVILSFVLLLRRNYVRTTIIVTN